ncbi:phosphonopyruvate decarboxylase [Roseomonas sp. SSH11]|uniref:Phosphonopyruvate decarboxylase n=1 Tax=Pararoseomonas baculiformis TaxID=2820812 RepID=A0ABS4AIV8_9PROT|nr:thiamine pyrophosphate-binding protein [Pararoseomonas baculiformis]MBP0446945.1 phosphonopyruvate decarboxylase [Pararoseomonas baculiformis]
MADPPLQGAQATRRREDALDGPRGLGAEAREAAGESGADWPDRIFDVLMEQEVRQVAYVPDGGHARLIRRLHAEPSVRAVPLTTEEEGVALLAGAWLGGQRGALLMQSSGVGNCVNMLSLVRLCRIPLLMLVTMRGEWGEFNPWQVPMGSTTKAALELMDMRVLRAERPEEVGEVVSAAARMAYGGGTPMAVLLAQRLIGAKVFVK